MVEVSRYDTVDYLDSEEMIAAYLNAAIEENDMDVLLTAISNIAKARGIAQLAKDAGLCRESLYKTLSPGAKPRFETIMKIINALGIALRAEIKREEAPAADIHFSK